MRSDHAGTTILLYYQTHWSLHKRTLTNHVFKSFQVWFWRDIKAVISKSVSYTLLISIPIYTIIYKFRLIWCKMCTKFLHWCDVIPCILNYPPLNPLYVLWGLLKFNGREKRDSVFQYNFNTDVAVGHRHFVVEWFIHFQMSYFEAITLLCWFFFFYWENTLDIHGRIVHNKNQCCRKLLLKVMHYKIGLLPKKVTS